MDVWVTWKKRLQQRREEETFPNIMVKIDHSLTDKDQAGNGEAINTHWKRIKYFNAGQGRALYLLVDINLQFPIITFIDEIYIMLIYSWVWMMRKEIWLHQKPVPLLEAISGPWGPKLSKERKTQICSNKSTHLCICIVYGNGNATIW